MNENLAALDQAKSTILDLVIKFGEAAGGHPHHGPRLLCGALDQPAGGQAVQSLHRRGGAAVLTQVVHGLVLLLSSSWRCRTSAWNCCR
jgi:hypothetical protein